MKQELDTEATNVISADMLWLFHSDKHQKWSLSKIYII